MRVALFYILLGIGAVASCSEDAKPAGSSSDAGAGGGVDGSSSGTSGGRSGGGTCLDADLPTATAVTLPGTPKKVEVTITFPGSGITVKGVGQATGATLVDNTALSDTKTKLTFELEEDSTPFVTLDLTCAGGTARLALTFVVNKVDGGIEIDVTQTY